MRSIASLLLVALGCSASVACGGLSTAEEVFGNNSGVGGAGSTSSTSDATATSTTATSSTTSTTTTSTSTSTSATSTSATTTSATTTSATTTSAATSTSSGGGNGTGCSDGTREYFTDMNAQPNIAGCAGGFDVPSVTSQASLSPACGRVSGNDSANPTGTGCSVEDLCEQGFHVCTGADDVAQSSSTGQCDPVSAGAIEFWLTRQVQDGQGVCIDPPGTNNITGCGSLGGTPQDPQSCAPLTNRMRVQDCAPTQAWFCGNSAQTDGAIEATLVLKVGPSEGGVLCCHD